MLLNNRDRESFTVHNFEGEQLNSDVWAELRRRTNTRNVHHE